jgi:hypothetical protein
MFDSSFHEVNHSIHSFLPCLRHPLTLCSLRYNADEEELSEAWKTAGGSDRDNVKIIFCPDAYEDLKGYGALIVGALWGAKTATIKAASKLTMVSYCLRYVPAAIRKHYLDWVDHSVYSQSKHTIYSYCWFTYNV